jgi:hypothetical protein
MPSREKMISDLSEIIAGRMTAADLVDMERIIWIQTPAGYRDTFGNVLTSKQFESWIQKTKIENFFIIPDNGRSVDSFNDGTEQN